MNENVVIGIVILYCFVSFIASVATLYDIRDLRDSTFYEVLVYFPMSLVILPIYWMIKLCEYIFNTKFIQKIHKFLNTPVKDVIKFRIKFRIKLEKV